MAPPLALEGFENFGPDFSALHIHQPIIEYLVCVEHVDPTLELITESLVDHKLLYIVLCPICW